MTLDELKKAAALRAVDYIEPRMVVGLGSGSTAEFAIRHLALRVTNGLQILAVPTSNRTASLARHLRIPLTSLHHHPRIDITIDGADEVHLSTLNVIKGLGGALLREKIVALSSQLLILIVDQTKLVHTLGLRNPLPVEVLPFGWERTSAALAALGCHPTRRLVTQPQIQYRGAHKRSELATKIQNRNRPYLTDSRNYLIDCKFPSIPHPLALAPRIKSITGVVDHGLFLNLPSRIIISRQSGIEIIDRD